MTTGTDDLEPRLLTKEQAARYCALSPRGFSSWVKIGRLPGPVTGTARWDRRAIDTALDKIMDGFSGKNVDIYDNWKASYNEGQLKRYSHSKEKTR